MVCREFSLYEAAAFLSFRKGSAFKSLCCFLALCLRSPTANSAHSCPSRSSAPRSTVSLNTAIYTSLHSSVDRRPPRQLQTCLFAVVVVVMVMVMVTGGAAVVQLVQLRLWVM